MYHYRMKGFIIVNLFAFAIFIMTLAISTWQGLLTGVVMALCVGHSYKQEMRKTDLDLEWQRCRRGCDCMQGHCDDIVADRERLKSPRYHLALPFKPFIGWAIAGVALIHGSALVSAKIF